MTIAYLGPKGTFTEIALATYFSNESVKLPKPSIEDVFQSVTDEESIYGVVPIENSIEGAVNNTLDQLLEREIYVIGEVKIPINQCLLAKNIENKEIINVYSHPQSFAQCRKWINDNLPKSNLTPVLSNSEGAIKVKSNTDACIGPNILSSYYNLDIIQTNIQDFKNNETRFLILSKSMKSIRSQSKTSIVIIPQTENKSGSLYSLLKPFSDNNINLTRIESRPVKTKNWKYSFYIDFEGNHEDEAIKNTLKIIQRSDNEIKILGSYNHIINMLDALLNE